MFPVEIWEEVFINLDAISLSKLRNVCHMFNSCINRILTTRSSWYWKCKEDIPEKYWLLLHEKSLNLPLLMSCAPDKSFDAAKDNHELWKNMYRSWIKWSKIEKFTAKTETIELDRSKNKSRFITCSDTLGNLLALGTSNGYIELYNIDVQRRVYVGDQCEYVKNINLVTKDDKIAIITISNTNITRFFNLAHKKCIQKGHADIICAGYGTFGAVLRSRIILNGTIFPILLSAKPYVATISGNNKVHLLLHDGCYLVFDGTEDLLMKNYISMPLFQPRRIQLFNPDVTICITENGLLGISVKWSSFQLYNVFQFLEAQITAVLFHVRVLALGSNIGQIYLFFVDNEEGLKSLNLRSTKSKKIQVCKEDITSIRLIEIDGEHHLVATSCNAFYIVSIV